MNQRNIIVILASLTAFAVILIVGANFVLKSITPAKRATPPPPVNLYDSNVKIQAPGGGKNTKVKIVNPENAPTDSRPITYTNAGFSPQEITVKISDPIGCLITVINKTFRPLKVGVSPHSPSGDPGANYGELSAEESGIFDVRYPGLAMVTLHDHATPTNEFTVVYGDGCR